MKARSISIKLWLLNTFIITATVSTYVCCSYSILSKTDSISLSAAIFASQWAAPIILYRKTNYLFIRYDASLVLMLSIAALIIFSPAVFFLDIPFIPFLITFVVGGIENIIKVGRLIIIKQHVEEKHVGKVSSFSSTGQFVGGALGGALFAATSVVSSIWLFPVSVTILFVAGLLIAAFLPRGEEAVERTKAEDSLELLRGAVAVLRSNGKLQAAIISLVSVCGLIQGFHNIARVSLPVLIWGGTDRTVGVLQILVAVSTIAGVGIYMVGEETFHRQRFVLGVAVGTVAAMLVVTISSNELAGITMYSILIFMFELQFLTYQTNVVRSTPKEVAARILSFQFLGINISMFLTIILGGIFVDLFGYVITAAAVAALYMFIILKTNRVSIRPEAC